MRTKHVVGVLGFNNHQVTEVCLARVRQSGFDGEIVLVDNGSVPPLAPLAAKYRCRVIRNDVNRYINPAWNQLFDACHQEPVRFLTLLNNDCLVRDGYLNEAPEIMVERQVALTSPTSLVVPNILAFHDELPRETAVPVLDCQAQYDGNLMTIDLRAYFQCRFRIPSRFKLYYGDIWIWGQLRSHGFLCGRIVNRTYVGERSRTIKDCKFGLSPVTESDARHAYNSPTMTRMIVLARLHTDEVLEDWKPKAGAYGRVRVLLSELRDRVQLWR